MVIVFTILLLLVTQFVNEHINELERAIKVTDLKELRLDEDGKIGYTYKTLGAAFWALKQNNFRYAIEKITMEVKKL